MSEILIDAQGSPVDSETKLHEFGDVSISKELKNSNVLTRMSRYSKNGRELKEKNRGLNDNLAKEIPEKEQKVDDKQSVEVRERFILDNGGIWKKNNPSERIIADNSSKIKESEK